MHLERRAAVTAAARARVPAAGLLLFWLAACAGAGQSQSDAHDRGDARRADAGGGPDASPASDPDASRCACEDPAQCDGVSACSQGFVQPWEALLDERVGFGSATTGGAGGALCDVTSLADDGPGSLRECLAAPAPRWIRFEISGDIDIDGSLEIPSDTTIDGRGAQIVLGGGGLAIKATENIIINDLRIEHGGPGANDAIGITQAASRIWLHHLSLADYPDGLIDIKRDSTDITVSWCHFRDHDKVMIVGNGADTEQGTAKNIRVTLHHNFFDGTLYRHPTLRQGKVHAFNNYLRGWGIYGMRSIDDGQLLVEANSFHADDNVDAVLAEDTLPSGGEVDEPGNVRAADNRLRGGARIQERNPGAVFAALDYYDYALDPADGALEARLEDHAGARNTPFPD